MGDQPIPSSEDLEESFAIDMGSKIPRIQHRMPQILFTELTDLLEEVLFSRDEASREEVRQRFQDLYPIIEEVHITGDYDVLIKPKGRDGKYHLYTLPRHFHNATLHPFSVEQKTQVD